MNFNKKQTTIARNVALIVLIIQVFLLEKLGKSIGLSDLLTFQLNAVCNVIFIFAAAIWIIFDLNNDGRVNVRTNQQYNLFVKMFFIAYIIISIIYIAGVSLQINSLYTIGTAGNMLAFIALIAAMFIFNKKGKK
ncbi:hypothetical protein [Mycoplasma sp. P36-A1]|uniref:hypothetical protein n=1 Tax=Mycoplasma sp. P36-A1 TaxID=3252900 RepID=UPI003C2F0A2A